MEVTVKDHVMKYLLSKGLISNKQHAFIAKHSTVTNLLEYTHDWAISLHSKTLVDVIYIDFSRAFDSVVHSRLRSRPNSLYFVYWWHCWCLLWYCKVFIVCWWSEAFSQESLFILEFWCSAWQLSVNHTKIEANLLKSVAYITPDIHVSSFNLLPAEKNILSFQLYVWAVVIVWKIRGKIIRTVLCCIVYHSCIFNHMQTRMSRSYRWNRAGWVRLIDMCFFLSWAGLFVIGLVLLYYVYYLVAVWLSVPAKLIAWKDSSLKWPVMCRVGRFLNFYMNINLYSLTQWNN